MSFQSIVDFNVVRGNQGVALIDSKETLRIINFYLSFIPNLAETKKSSRVAGGFNRLVFFLECPYKKQTLEVPMLFCEGLFPPGCNRWSQQEKSTYLVDKVIEPYAEWVQVFVTTKQVPVPPRWHCIELCQKAKTSMNKRPVRRSRRLPPIARHLHQLPSSEYTDANFMYVLKRMGDEGVTSVLRNHVWQLVSVAYTVLSAATKLSERVNSLMATAATNIARAQMMEDARSVERANAQRRLTRMKKRASAETVNIVAVKCADPSCPHDSVPPQGRPGIPCLDCGIILHTTCGTVTDGGSDVRCQSCVVQTGLATADSSSEDDGESGDESDDESDAESDEGVDEDDAADAVDRSEARCGAVLVSEEHDSPEPMLVDDNGQILSKGMDVVSQTLTTFPVFSDLDPSMLCRALRGVGLCSGKAGNPHPLHSSRRPPICFVCVCFQKCHWVLLTLFTLPTGQCELLVYEPRLTSNWLRDVFRDLGEVFLLLGLSAAVVRVIRPVFK